MYLALIYLSQIYVNYDHKLHLSCKIAVFYHELGVKTFEQDVLVCKYKW